MGHRNAHQPPTSGNCGPGRFSRRRSSLSPGKARTYAGKLWNSSEPAELESPKSEDEPVQNEVFLFPTCFSTVMGFQNGQFVAEQVFKMRSLPNSQRQTLPCHHRRLAQDSPRVPGREPNALPWLSGCPQADRVTPVGPRGAVLAGRVTKAGDRDGCPGRGHTGASCMWTCSGTDRVWILKQTSVGTGGSPPSTCGSCVISS